MNNRTFCFVLLSLSLLLLCTPLVLHAQWEPDRRLTFNDCSAFTSSNNAWCVAAGPQGDVHVVWCDDRIDPYVNWEIYYKRSTDAGRTWLPDVRLTWNPEISNTPSVAVSVNSVHVVWCDHRDGNPEIYYRRGLAWNPEIRLSRDSNASECPSLAASGPYIYAVWQDDRDSVNSPEIYFRRSTNWGKSWLVETRLTYNGSQSLSPSIAAFDSMVYIVWHDFRDDNWEIYYKRSTNWGLSWSSDIRLTNHTFWSQYPSIAASGSGVHVVWNGYWDDCDIFYKRSTDGGTTWLSDTNITAAPLNSYYPSIAAYGPNIHVVWDDLRNVNDEIYFKCSTDGGSTWSVDTNLTNIPDSFSIYPSVAVSGTVVHTVWMDNRDTHWDNCEIYYKRNPTGNPIGIETPNLAEENIPYSPFRTTPNPFTTFAFISGHEGENFALYDVSGRRVGVYRGDRIGEGLRAGVYFVRAEEGKRKPLRVVKIR